MKFSIVPYQGDSPMKPWPSLAGKAFCLKSDSGSSQSSQSIFYYDSPPIAGNMSTETAASSPVFVLIHGLGDEADSWRHLIPLLNANGCRALALDLPGFGRSVAAGRISFKGHAAAVIDLIEALKVTGPLFLVGSSMGALLAEAVAIQKPKLAQGLVLIGGSIPGRPPSPGLFALAKHLFSRKWYRSYRNAPKEAWASLHPYYADLDSMPFVDREFLKERVMARVQSSTQEQAFFATNRSVVFSFMFASPRFTRKIRAFKGKILLIWGEKDRIIPLSCANTFKTLRQETELKVITGAGHLPQQENPVETARFIAELIESKP